VTTFCYWRGHRISSLLIRGIEKPARDKISRIKGMSRNRTSADFVVRRRLLDLRPRTRARRRAPAATHKR
jgi:hypothetical protein